MCTYAVAHLKLKPGASFSLYIATVYAAYEYLIINRGGYLCTNSLQHGWMLPREAEMVFD